MNYKLPFGKKTIYLYYLQRIREVSMIFKRYFLLRNIFYYCPIRKQKKRNHNQPTWFFGGGQSHNAQAIPSGWGISVANQSSDKCSSAVSQAEKKKHNLKGGHGHGRSFCTSPGKPACLCSSLKSLYTNAHSMGNKQEELEICVQ